MSVAGAGAPTNFDVFLSYARSQSRDQSRDEAVWLRDALDAALGAGRTYLDTRDAPVDERFPDDIQRALLGSRVVVAFVGATYFRKWWCLKEWHFVLSPYALAPKPGGHEPSREAKGAGLRHLVIALPTPDMGDPERRLLPPDAQVRTTVKAADTAALVELVRRRLAESSESLAQHLERLGVLAEVIDAFAGEEAIPPARPTNRCRQYPVSLPASLQRRFVGRADDLWRLHTLLVAGSAPEEFAPTSVNVRAFAGVGKSTIAREYLHRFGPSRFRGGLFWIDASESGESLARQHHGIWKAIDAAAPRFEDLEADLKDPGRLSLAIARALEQAFHALPAEERVLVVIDNVPEERAGAAELATWCPAPEKVSVLSTSRAGITGVTEQLELDVLDTGSAIALLTRHGLRGELGDAEWQAVVEWVGCVPQALVLLSEALGKRVLLPRELLQHAQGSAAIHVLDAQVAALDGLVPEAARRGIAQAFALSLAHLPDDARGAAQRLAWFAPAPMPDVLVDAVLEVIGDEGGRRCRGVLSERSFIAREGSPPMWRMHRLLAEFLRGGEAPQGRWHAAAKALATVLTEERCKNHLLREEHAECVPAARAIVARRPAISSDGFDEVGGILLDLGRALGELGGISASSVALVAASEAYRSALEVRTRDRVPLDWAKTQRDLGIVLRVLGSREEGTGRLEESLAAYRCALQVYTRADDPLEWAKTMTNLGIVLKVLGEREDGTRRLKVSLKVFRSALKVCTRDREPQSWVMVQNSLGNVLRVLGEREGVVGRLKESLKAYQSALDVCRREHEPLTWAMTKNNLGVVLRALGAREQGTRRLEESVSACLSALDVYKQERAPLDWAMTQYNLGIALWVLGEREEGTERLQKALEAYTSALTVWERSLPHRAPWVRQLITEVKDMIAARGGGQPPT